MKADPQFGRSDSKVTQRQNHVLLGYLTAIPYELMMSLKMNVEKDCKINRF